MLKTTGTDTVFHPFFSSGHKLHSHARNILFPDWERFIPKVGTTQDNKERVLRNKGWLLENKGRLLQDLTWFSEKVPK
jgi:hypothetical protein